MDPRTQERVEQWDSRPFNGGQDGLVDLADEGFSGVVTTGDVWLFVLNGRAVGVDGGDLEDVETATGTAYVAPDPALPLLAAMETRGGETRAKYYTNKTSLSDVDETLQDGSFTGYVELSEQVLSGDYYLVYYGGRRMAAAYIGNAERLLTGEEAFERAADEVGIYEVVDVDVDVVDLSEVVDDEPEDKPTPESTGGEQQVETADDATVDTDASVEDATTGVDATATPTEAAEPAVADTGEGRTASTAAEESSSELADEPVTGEPASSESAEGVSIRAEKGTESTDAPDTAGDDRDRKPTEELSTDAADAETAVSTEADASEQTDESTPAEPTDEPEESADRPEKPPTGDDVSSDGLTTASFSERVVDSGGEEAVVDKRFKQEERWRETRSIPSIDPEKTSGSTTRHRATDSEKTSGSTTRHRATDRNDSETTTSSASSASQPSAHTSSRPTASERTGPNTSKTDTSSTDHRGRDAHVEKLRDQRDALQAKLEEYQDERERLGERNEELTEERDTLRAKNRNLSATVERLEERVEELEAKLERARSVDATGAVTDSTGSTGRSLPADRALEGTNLFVRYESKGKATLEKVHAGEAEPEQVSENLRLEHHTDFDASAVTVDGQPYEEFLPTTMEYRFVDWLVDTLLYEIRDTGRTGGLADLYDAIPAIDRIELAATVSLADDDTEDVPTEVGFDVVVFDKMGRPLVVANLNDSRDPATREMLEHLEETASAVKANYPELAAAVAVTSSFFQPGALEVTEVATSGGLLSRSSKLNYVNVSRKQGYHLCLVEARSGGFHMTVPEL